MSRFALLSKRVPFIAVAARSGLCRVAGLPRRRRAGPGSQRRINGGANPPQHYHLRRAPG